MRQRTWGHTDMHAQPSHAAANVLGGLVIRATSCEEGPHATDGRCTCRAEFRVWHEGPEAFYIMFKVWCSTCPHCQALMLAAKGSRRLSHMPRLGLIREMFSAGRGERRESTRAGESGPVSGGVGSAERADEPAHGGSGAARRAESETVPGAATAYWPLRSMCKQPGSCCPLPWHLPLSMSILSRRRPSTQVNFHTTLSGQAMVTMIYHKKLGPEWQAAAEKLRRLLGACPSSTQPAVEVIGRSHKQKVELDHGYVIERLAVDGRSLTYKQVRTILAPLLSQGYQASNTDVPGGSLRTRRWEPARLEKQRC